MQTLEEAVDTLNKMEDPQKVLTKYSNVKVFDDFRCTSCPVAQWLAEQVGREVWVSSQGLARFMESYSGYQLGPHIQTIIKQFDTQAAGL